MLTLNYCVFKALNPVFEYILEITFVKAWGSLKPEDWE